MNFKNLSFSNLYHSFIHKHLNIDSFKKMIVLPLYTGRVGAHNIFTKKLIIFSFLDK